MFAFLSERINLTGDIKLHSLAWNPYEVNHDLFVYSFKLCFIPSHTRVSDKESYLAD